MATLQDSRRLPRHHGLVALLALAALVVMGLGAADASAAKRPYVYVFSLDGLDRDAVTDEGSAPFLSELIADENGARSTFFPRSRSVMVAETNPNHTSMITGAYPSRHGIVGNEFATYGAGANENSCPAEGEVRCRTDDHRPARARAASRSRPRSRRWSASVPIPA